MKTMKNILSLMGIFLIISSLGLRLSAQDKEDELKGKKILFVYGGWDGHEPVPFYHFFKPWLESEGAIVYGSQTLDCYADSSLMNQIDLIIQVWTMGEITSEQEQGLLNAVKNGVGIAGWHGGTGDSFRNNCEYQFMIGGQWVSHPGGSVDYEVNITDSKDSIVKGLSDFKMHSEQYYMHVDPNVKVLATTTYSGVGAEWIKGCVMPVVWKKYYGKGRVFYSSLAHGVNDMKVSEALEIMKRGIRWASQSKYETREHWVSPVYKK